jgi:signal transduction histidine kinase
MPAAYLMLLVMLVLTAIAAAAVDHPDEQIRLKPLTMFRRSLLMKLGGINALVVWLLAVVAMALFFPTHVNNEAADHSGAMSRDVRFFVQAHDARVYALISEADTVARDAQTVGLVAGDAGPGEYSPQIVDGLTAKSGFGITRVVNAEGVILFSSFRKDDVGTVHVVSPALNAALGGRVGSGWEHSPTFGTWVMRAASPVIVNGKVAGAVVMAEIDRAFVADGDALSQVASGYGMVSPDGDLAFSSGRVLNADERSRLRAAIVSGDVLNARINDKQVFAAPAELRSGVPGGVYYAFLSDKDRDARIFLDIVSLASFIYFGIALMAAMLFAAMAGVLRPLREMRDAALKLGGDRSIDEIRYDSPDEIGQLATAFNATASIVNQRAGALTAAMRERQDFLDHAARELRTPLTVFRWTLEAMRFGETGTFTKEQLDMLEKLHQTNLRLERMVENLQDLNQVDRNRVKLTLKPVRVEDLIDVAAGEMSVQSRIKGIDLRWDRPEKPLPTVHADAAYVQKVLHNIVENAVKYTQPHGAITMHAETTDMSAPDGRPGAFVQITVKDSGIGIPTDESPRLFNRFFRAQNVAEFEIEGAGLGLYLAKRFVELHGGDIRVASQVGVGTTVTFTLPIHTP